MRFAFFIRPMFCAFVALAAFASSAPAALLKIGDVGLNSTLTYNTSTGLYTNWSVDGRQVLGFLRGFAWRVGNTDEVTVGDRFLTPGTQGTLDINFDPGDDTLRSIWTDHQQRFRISLITTLTAGLLGSNQATFTESIRIDNLSGAPLAFSLLLVADYNLNKFGIDDSVVFSNPRSVTQTWGRVVQETSVTISPDYYQAATLAEANAIINDGVPTTFSNNSSSFDANLTYGFQWNFNIATGRSVTLGTTNSVTVPEASSLALASLAVGGVVLWARRRRAA